MAASASAENTRAVAPVLRLASAVFVLCVLLCPESVVGVEAPGGMFGDKLDKRLLDVARACTADIGKTCELRAQALGIDTPQPGPPETSATSSASSSDRGAASATETRKRTEEEEAETEVLPEESVDSAEEAMEATDDEIAAFLARDELGFDVDTIDHMRDEIADAVDAVVRGFDRFGEASFIDKLKMSLPFQLVVLFLIAFFVIDRRARHLRRELWDLVPPLSTPILDNLLDSALRVLARTLPVALMLIPVYFPLTGLFPDESWIEALTRILWLVLIYRAALTVGTELLIGEVFGFEPKPRRLQRWWQLGLRIWLVLWVLHDTFEIVGARADVIALLAFSTKVFVAIYALRLFTMADELVMLVPHIPDSGLYSIVRRVLTTYVHAFVGLSVLLMLLWSAGFSTAASFILVRTYSLIGLLLLSLWIYRRAQRSLRKLIERHEGPDGEPLDIERHRVLRSLERSALTVGGVALVWAVLNLIGVWDMLVRLASIPIVVVGDGIRISIFVVVRALTIFVVFVLLSRIVRAVLNEKVYPKFEVDVGVGYAINTTFHYFLLVLGIMLGLDSLGLDLSGVAIFASALGIGIGFGLQDIVSNLISGFILLFGRSVKKGDYVTVNESFGRVDSVGARSVTITTPDNFELVIPSSELVGNSIVNWTLTSPYIRVSLPVGVTYDCDVDEVSHLLIEAAKRHPRVLKRPKPEVWLEEFGDNSVNFSLLVYIDLRRTNQRRFKGELNFHVWNVLAEHDIEIPFPQRDLHFRSGFDPSTNQLQSVVEGMLKEYARTGGLAFEPPKGVKLDVDSDAPAHPDQSGDSADEEG